MNAIYHVKNFVYGICFASNSTKAFLQLYYSRHIMSFLYCCCLMKPQNCAMHSKTTARSILALKALLPKENKERIKKWARYRWGMETQTDFLKSTFQRHTINQWQKVWSLIPSSVSNFPFFYYFLFHMILLTHTHEQDNYHNYDATLFYSTKDE